VTAAVAGVMVTAALAFGGVASAATTVGNNCLANFSFTDVTIVQTATDAGQGIPAAVPSAGVITSWSTNVPSILKPGVLVEKMEVFEPTGTAGALKLVGETPLEPILGTLNKFPTRIPVKAGDLIGSTGTAQTEGESQQAVLYCKEQAATDRIGAIAGEVGVGANTAIAEEAANASQPVTVQVEPDADGDGYGDETQDQCPTDATTQGACPPPKVTPPTPVPPAPPAPITLSGTATAKSGFVTVNITASASASVTVTGNVALGKGATVKLSGGTETVVPGSLAKFTIPYPAKLAKALKGLPKSKKLTLKLGASAPGATSTNLTVKVPGQQKPPRHHPRRK
jgi:hypothetical protein